MNPYQIKYSMFLKDPVKTTPQNVQEANESLFHCKMTLPAAAEHCGMTQKEMRMTFTEYLKYNPANYGISQDDSTLDI